MYCSYCGKKIKDGANFCVNCGGNVSQSQQVKAEKLISRGEKVKKRKSFLWIVISIVLISSIVIAVVLLFTNFTNSPVISAVNNDLISEFPTEIKENDHIQEEIIEDDSLEETFVKVESDSEDIVMTAVSDTNLAVLREDGTVELYGLDYGLNEYLSQWEDIVYIDIKSIIAAGNYNQYVLGITSSGKMKIEAITANYLGQEVERLNESDLGLSDIENIRSAIFAAAGNNYAFQIMYITNEGEIQMCGEMEYVKDSFDTYTDITQIFNKYVDLDTGISQDTQNAYAAINSDGICVSLSDLDLSKLENVIDIVQINNFFIAVLSDGTCSLVGDIVSNDDDFNKTIYDVLSMTDVKEILVNQYSSAFYSITVLKYDGTIEFFSNIYLDFDFSQFVNVENIYTTHEENYSNINIVGIKSDGTLVATGMNKYSQFNEICSTAVPNYSLHINATNQEFALDATFGCDLYGEIRDNELLLFGRDIEDYDISSWGNLKEIVFGEKDTETSAGPTFIAGLNVDGTVEYAMNLEWQDKAAFNVVETWTDIVSVDAGYEHIVALKDDGTVHACSLLYYLTVSTEDVSPYDFSDLIDAQSIYINDKGQCNVSEWTDIVEIAAGPYYTLGLKSDGTVVATGENLNTACNVYGWSDIVSIATNGVYTIGLKSDGTVVSTDNFGHDNNTQNWTDIVGVYSYCNKFIGVKSDGILVSSYEKSNNSSTSSYSDIYSYIYDEWDVYLD